MNQGKLKTIIHNSLFMIPSHRGFTLIELLIAIAIIGVLAVASIVMINPLEQIKKSRDAQRKQDLRQLQIALESYNSDNNLYPADDGSGGIAGVSWGSSWLPYIAKVPKDPLSTQSYRYTSTGRTYRVDAILENCKDPQIIGDCAYFNYQVTSSNVAIAALPTPIPTPTPTPILPQKKVFLTSSTQNGNFGGLQGADDTCRDLANAASLGGTWKAWLSTSTANAKDRIGNYKYVRMDGLLVANGKTDLTDGTISNPININENGVVDSVEPYAWTGTTSQGLLTSNTCVDWNDRYVNGEIGYSHSQVTDSRWTDLGTRSCGNLTQHLYCFEQ